MTRVSWLLIGLLLTACSAKQVPVPTPTVIDLAPADALVRVGCYRCLLDAYAIYQRAHAAPTPQPEARGRLFVTSILLALREKELDLDATVWLDRAHPVATPDERVYLDLVAAIPWDGGASPDFSPAVPLTSAMLDDWRRLTVPTQRHPELDYYLLLTLECRVGTRATMLEALRLPADATPLLRYRAGSCAPSQRAVLEQLVQDEPRYVEAWYFLGRFEMASGVNAAGGAGNRRWLSTALPPLIRAHDALPEAPTPTTVLARLMAARSDYARALSFYDDALSQRATHADALLGRTVMLSYLKKYDEGIAAANRIIGLERGHVASAYYYRAWNRYQKRELDEAARDVATARRLNATEEVLVLSGLVAYDQERFLDARRDFTHAVQGNPARCTAHWYLGILDLDDRAWSGALTTFGAAAECYVSQVESLERHAGELPDDLPADVRAAQLTSLNDDIAHNRRQAGRAYFNAAQAAVRLNDRPRALQHARMASTYEELRERAESIVKTMETGP